MTILNIVITNGQYSGLGNKHETKLPVTNGLVKVN